MVNFRFGKGSSWAGAGRGGGGEVTACWCRERQTSRKTPERNTVMVGAPSFGAGELSASQPQGTTWVGCSMHMTLPQTV